MVGAFGNTNLTLSTKPFRLHNSIGMAHMRALSPNPWAKIKVELCSPMGSKMTGSIFSIKAIVNTFSQWCRAWKQFVRVNSSSKFIRYVGWESCMRKQRNRRPRISNSGLRVLWVIEPELAWIARPSNDDMRSWHILLSRIDNFDYPKNETLHALASNAFIHTWPALIPTSPSESGRRDPCRCPIVTISRYTSNSKPTRVTVLGLPKRCSKLMRRVRSLGAGSNAIRKRTGQEMDKAERDKPTAWGWI